MSQTPAPSEPATIHFLAPISVITGPGDGFGAGEVMKYGDELVLTDAIRQLAVDRNGACFFDLLDDEDGQVARWGKVVFRRGPFPEGQVRAERGSPEWFDLRQVARAGAHALPDPEQRRAALRQVEADFGPPPATSRTTATFDQHESSTVAAASA